MNVPPDDCLSRAIASSELLRDRVMPGEVVIVAVSERFRLADIAGLLTAASAHAPGERPHVVILCREIDADARSACAGLERLGARVTVAIVQVVGSSPAVVPMPDAPVPTPGPAIDLTTTGEFDPLQVLRSDGSVDLAALPVRTRRADLSRLRGEVTSYARKLWDRPKSFDHVAPDDVLLMASDLLDYGESATAEELALIRGSIEYLLTNNDRLDDFEDRAGLLDDFKVLWMVGTHLGIREGTPEV